MKRLLIVSPHFPPVSAADMQRVRMLLPFFRENGWDAEVLAASPDQVKGPLDPWLAAELPADVQVHRVSGPSVLWSRIPGLGGLGFRALRGLRNEGDRLLAAGNFDLIYFSTTVFEVHILGPRWRRKFGVPFVMDYQDPWVNDYYRAHPSVVPPGGRTKFFLADAIHRWMEPRVLRYCAGITSVSPDYPEQIGRRYRSMLSLPSLVQPFPGARRDFERLPAAPDGRLRERDNALHWVYVGRGGPDMTTAIRGLFLALLHHAPDDLRSRLKLHFIGTSYAPPGTGEKSVTRIAAEFGITNIVDESPDRIPYAKALARLRDADALIVPGSDDPSYTASKIYPYLLARRPLLAIFHRNSTVVDLMNRVGGGVCVPFATGESAEALAARIGEEWLSRDQYHRTVPLDEKQFEPYSDRGSAVTISRFLNRCIAT